MRFKVLKSSLDGISGGASDFKSIDDVLREVHNHTGWESLKAMHTAITKWAKKAHPGDVFCTSVTAIVAAAVDVNWLGDDICDHCGHEGLDYGELDPVEGGEIEQKVKCPQCGKRWMDIFTLTEQHDLCEDEL